MHDSKFLWIIAQLVLITALLPKNAAVQENQANDTTGVQPTNVSIDPASNPPKVEPLDEDNALNTRLVGSWRSEIFMTQRAVYRDLGDGRWAQRQLNVYPFYNTIYLNAEEVGHKGLSIHLQGWSGLDLADVYFDQRFVADPTFLYIQFNDYGLNAKAGRQMIFTGAAKGLHLDGLSVSYQTPFYLGIQGLGGLVVSPKFGPDWYDGETADSFDDYGAGFSDWKRETDGDYAVGGRLFFRQAGTLSVGVSVLHMTRYGETDQQVGGVDLDIVPAKWMSITGDVYMMLQEVALREANAAFDFFPIKYLSFGVDYRHADPTLYISNLSIFSVFSDEKYDAVGGTARIFPVEWLTLHGGYHERFYRYVKNITEPGVTLNNIYGQVTLWGYETNAGAEAYFAKTGVRTLLEFRRFAHDLNAMNQFRVAGGVPIFDTGLLASANFYLDLFDVPYLGRNGGILGDLGLHWTKNEWELGGAFSAGYTPYARHEVGGMLKAAYNLDYSFVERRKP